MRAAPRWALSWLTWQGSLAAGFLSTALALSAGTLAGFLPEMALLAVTVLATVALLIGVSRHRPGVDGGLWWPVPACAAITVVGGLLQVPLDADPPLPSDFVHLGFYPLIVSTALSALPTRLSRHDRSSLVEALIVSCAIATIAWVGAGSARAQDGVGLLQYAYLIAFPLLNLLPLAVVLRRTVPQKAQPTAFYLYVAMFMMTLPVDITFALDALRGNPVGLPIAASWWSLRVVSAAAALHPWMGRLADPPPDGAAPLSRARLAVLGCAAATGPALLFLQWVGGGPLYLVFIVAATVSTISLVIVRMAQILRANERAKRQAQILQAASAALVGASDRYEAASAAVSTAEELFALEGDPWALVALVRDGDLVVKASSGEAPLPGAHLEGMLDQDRNVDAGAAAEALPRILGRDYVACVPIAGPEGCIGLLAVATGRRLNRQMRDAARALASAATLAIQRAQYAEDLLMKRGQERFAALVRNAADVIVVVDRNGRLTYASPSASIVFGRDPEELSDTDPLGLLDPDGGQHWSWALLAQASAEGPARISGRILHASGERKHFDATVANLLDDPDIAGLVLTVRDITARVELEEALEHQAHHDPLTGLANRRLFTAKLRDAMAAARLESLRVAVLMVDLDDFKTINDSLGHSAGDELLVIIAQRLQDCIRGEDVVARVGGDEFAVLLAGADITAQVADITARLTETCSAPATVNGHGVTTGCTVGVAVMTGGERAEDLLRNADAAMYVAKRQGKNRAAMFTPDMHAEAVRRLELKNDLSEALNRGEFEIYYQPIIALHNDALYGWEALIRWNHRRRGQILPDDFVPVAEETGLIIPIGRWVLQTACAQVAEWRRRWPGNPATTVSVNVSPRQFGDDDLVDDVIGALDASGLDPSTLLLEITENTIISDPDGAIAKLQVLRHYGVRIAIDDFGTGYSSLSYLHRFPVDVLKIDKSFVGTLADPNSDSTAMFAILALAREMSLTTVAEGVECAEELGELIRASCPLGQGWLFSKALPAAEAEHLLARSWRAGTSVPVTRLAAAGLAGDG